MNRLPRIRRANVSFILGLVLVGCLVASAGAQCPPPFAANPLAEGEVGIFTDAAGITNCMSFPFGVVTLYVIARVPAGGIASFEIPGAVSTSPFWVTLNSEFPGTPGFDELIVLDGCKVARRTNTAACPVVQGDLILIGLLSGFYTGVGPESLCFEFSCPTLSEPEVRAPTFTRCDNGETQSFVLGQYLCVGNNASPLAIKDKTWGGVKAIYR